ncbi:MAG: polysaccharide deacetylase family protein [Spirochaetota bacterium]
MKVYIAIAISILLLLGSLCSYLLLEFNKNEADEIIVKEIQWKKKEKESDSRPFSIPILLYHDIDGKGVYSLTKDNIRTHFQFLKDNNIKVIKLSELISRLENPVPFNDKVIVISFDDGFLSMFTKLLPLVKEFGYPITLFVYTNNIYLKANNNITWSHLRRMEEVGIDVECHSMSHIDMEELSSGNSPGIQKKLFDEIYLSKRIIELYMNKQVNYFAFPYGRYNLKLIDLCRFSGYKRAFSTAYRSNIITRDNYCLGRGHIKNNYSLDFIEEIIK